YRDNPSTLVTLYRQQPQPQHDNSINNQCSNSTATCGFSSLYDEKLELQRRMRLIEQQSELVQKLTKLQFRSSSHLPKSEDESPSESSSSEPESKSSPQPPPGPAHKVIRTF